MENKKLMPYELRADQNRLLIFAYFFFKSLPTVVSGFAIFLGYKLFVLGVTGQASLIVKSTSITGQLLNAAPGLFFAVGGLVCLAVVVWKGVKLEFTYPEGTTKISAMAASQKDEVVQDLLVGIATDYWNFRHHWPRFKWQDPNKSLVAKALERAGVQIIDPKGEVLTSDLKSKVEIADILSDDRMNEPRVAETHWPIFVYHGQVSRGIVSAVAPRTEAQKLREHKRR